MARSGKRRGLLWLVLFTLWAGLAPVAMTILVPLGLPRLVWFWGIFLPGLLIHAGLFVYAADSDRALLNRLLTGLWVGLVGTVALDLFRLTGVALGVFGDMAFMFGAMLLTAKPLLDLMMELARAELDPDFSLFAAAAVGYILHYLNGVGMTTVFAVLFGGLRPFAGFWYAMLIELGMMLSPAVVMMMGPFGLATGGFGVLLFSFLAHAAWGLTMGYLTYRFIRPRGLFWKLRSLRVR